MITSIVIVLRHLIYGGTEKYALNLANSLVEKGVQVTLISGDGPLASHVSPKVNLHIMPISRNQRIKAVAEKRILEIVREARPQVIHTQCRTALVCSQLARKTLGIPLITHEHHMYDDADYPFIVGELRDGAEHIITLGPYTAKKLITNGLSKHTIKSILNGVDTEAIRVVTPSERAEARKILHLSSSDKVILCLSRVEAGKGIDKLARAFVMVAQRVPNAKLLIVGDEDTNIIKSFLKTLITAHNLQNKLFIYNGEYDIRKYHAAADIFCYPALAKGMAVMEAMAAGLPVVGKRTNRKPFVVEDGVSGFMTNSTVKAKIDPDEIAKNLIYLLQKPRTITKMGQAARKRIEAKFTLKNTVKNVLSLYTKIVADYSIVPQGEFLMESIAVGMQA